MIEKQERSAAPTSEPSLSAMGAVIWGVMSLSFASFRSITTLYKCSPSDTIGSICHFAEAPRHPLLLFNREGDLLDFSHKKFTRGCSNRISSCAMPMDRTECDTRDVQGT